MGARLLAETGPGSSPLVAVRRAALADLADLARLESAAFGDPWSEAMLREELALADSLLWAARRALAPGLEGYAAFRVGLGEAELLRVAVAPECRRAGLARALVSAGLAHLATLALDSCHLEVRAGNFPALALYAELGFVRVGLRPRYYRDGTDALLLTRDLRVPLDSP